MKLNINIFGKKHDQVPQPAMTPEQMAAQGAPNANAMDAYNPMTNQYSANTMNTTATVNPAGLGEAALTNTAPLDMNVQPNTDQPPQTMDMSGPNSTTTNIIEAPMGANANTATGSLDGSTVNYENPAPTTLGANTMDSSTGAKTIPVTHVETSQPPTETVSAPAATSFMPAMDTAGPSVQSAETPTSSFVETSPEPAPLYQPDGISATPATETFGTPASTIPEPGQTIAAAPSVEHSMPGTEAPQPPAV